MQRSQTLLLILVLVLGASLAQEWWRDYKTQLPPDALNTALVDDSATGLQPVSLMSADPDPVAQSSISESRETAITRAVRKVSPAVVGINVVTVVAQQYDQFFDFYFPRVYEREVPGLGSGFLISRDGLVLTNQHVIDKSREIVVTLTDGTKHNAKLVGQDPQTDIALLRIEGKNFPHIDLGNSDQCIVGEWVIALGNPFGLFEFNDQPAVSVGVISALDRDFGVQEGSRVYQDMIQTDAAINPGNSGGPLVNAMGEVIGVNSFIFTGSQSSQGSIGLGFALPINKVKAITSEIMDHGDVDRRFYTGLTLQPINGYIARRLGLRSTNGALVRQIESGSPADQAGLQPGDVIIKAAGKDIQIPQDVVDVIKEADLRAGSKMELELLRNGQSKTTSLILGRVLPGNQ